MAKISALKYLPLVRTAQRWPIIKFYQNLEHHNSGGGPSKNLKFGEMKGLNSTYLR